MIQISHRLAGWVRVHRLLIACGTAGVLAAVVIMLGTFPGSPRRPQHKQAASWEHSPPDLIAIGNSRLGKTRFWTLSSSGRFLCAIDDGGHLLLWETRGRKIMETSAGTADTVIPAPSGRWLLAYSRIDNEQAKVALINSRNRSVTSLSLNGAVWCADAASSGDTDGFAIGTGSGSLYVLHSQGKGWRRRTAKMPGCVISADLDPLGANVAVGCWQSSTISLIGQDMSSIWEIARDSQSLQDVSLLHHGERVFVESRPNNPMKAGEYGMLDAAGQAIWMRGSCFAAAERFHPSANGMFVAVAYVRPIKSKQKTVYERHCLILDADGKEMTDKGSLFSDVRPILMADSGYAIVHNGNKSIMSLGSSNDLRTLAQVPSRIVDARKSADGSTVAVRTEDGEARVYRVVQ